ncbi:MAG TPA: cell envelope biogenesis protein TolA [Allosphingosinicella sp.]|nr:cell envelope biogenesis protein TolA [Allosphingosinicella sp.]
MDRTEVTGFSVAVVGHAALLAALTLGLTMAGNPRALPPAMEVSFVDEVGLVSAAPTPSAEPAAQALAPEIGPVEDAAPAPATPRPAPREALPAPSPEPAPAPARRTPTRPAKPGTSGSAEQTRRAGLGDLDPRSFGRDPAARATTPPAAAMSARAAADIGSAITRQVQPCADRQVDPGPGANRIVTTLNLRLNRDGSLAARPRMVRQSGLDDTNSRYAQRVADIAIAAFTGCAPLRGLPDELYDVPRGWSNFTMNYRLPG